MLSNRIRPWTSDWGSLVRVRGGQVRQAGLHRNGPHGKGASWTIWGNCWDDLLSVWLLGLDSFIWNFQMHAKNKHCPPTVGVMVVHVGIWTDEHDDVRYASWHGKALLQRRLPNGRRNDKENGDRRACAWGGSGWFRVWPLRVRIFRTITEMPRLYVDLGRRCS